MALNESQKRLLLKIARESIEETVNGKPIDAPTDPTDLPSGSGAFVSLHKDGRLRGCIGVFASRDPLDVTVSNMAKAAATQDPRFSPVGPDELPLLAIEISVLSPLRRITDVNEIEVGRHGIYIMQGKKRGVLLPQVATEHGFDRETFLDETCMKAGLEPQAWRNGAEIHIFEAEIFREDGLRA